MSACIRCVTGYAPDPDTMCDRCLRATATPENRADWTYSKTVANARNRAAEMYYDQLEDAALDARMGDL